MLRANRIEVPQTTEDPVRTVSEGELSELRVDGVLRGSSGIHREFIPSLIGFGVTALVIIVLTRGRLGYGRLLEARNAPRREVK